MKSWNKCVQYWLAIYVYKRFPNKKFRTLVTLAVSAFWHGVLPGHYFCILAAPFYMPVDDLITKLRHDLRGLQLKIGNVASWISKFFAFSYMGIAFQCRSLDKIIQYYRSVYFSGYLLWLIMYCTFTILHKYLRKHKRA